MAKGNGAKALVVKKLIEAFGEDYIGEYDKKHFVWSKEDGEKIQVAISLTCPKVPVGSVNISAAAGKIDFEAESTIAPTSFTPAEMTEEEKENLAELMAKLGL